MEDHVGIVFERNIFVAHGTPVARGMTADRWQPHQVQLINNLYWCEDGAVRFQGNLADVVATQPFDHSYLDEAERFRPLPENRAPVRLIHKAGHDEVNDENAVALVCLREGDRLTITGRFSVPVGDMPKDVPLWGRPRLEVFLKPFPGCSAVAQFTVADNGDKGMLWHGCPVPDSLEWTARAGGEKADGYWTTKIVVPLKTVEDWVRRTCDVAGAETAEWRWLGGATLPPRSVSFAEWEKHTGETGGMVADPLFVDAARQDYRLRPESPALKLGFTPFEYPVERSTRTT
jgi:hypothetical protein